MKQCMWGGLDEVLPRDHGFTFSDSNCIKTDSDMVLTENWVINGRRKSELNLACYLVINQLYTVVPQDLYRGSLPAAKWTARPIIVSLIPSTFRISSHFSQLYYYLFCLTKLKSSNILSENQQLAAHKWILQVILLAKFPFTCSLWQPAVVKAHGPESTAGPEPGLNQLSHV